MRLALWTATLPRALAKHHSACYDVYPVMCRPCNAVRTGNTSSYSRIPSIPLGKLLRCTR
jgi:hypothetical protein